MGLKATKQLKIKEKERKRIEGRGLGGRLRYPTSGTSPSSMGTATPEMEKDCVPVSVSDVRMSELTRVVGRWTNAFWGGSLRE